MRKEGADGLSIRRLAEKLHVTPMAIYRHFDSKDALLSALLDQFIRAAEVLPEKKTSWEKWILHVGHRMWEAQVQDPDWITLLGSVQIRSGGLGVMLNSLEALTNAGFSNENALEAFFTMVHISIGASCLTLGLRQLDITQAIDSRDAGNLQKLQSEYGSIEKALAAQQVDKSLQLLVEGLRGRLAK